MIGRLTVDTHDPGAREVEEEPDAGRAAARARKIRVARVWPVARRYQVTDI
jgi:hypothetical protein